MWHPLASMHRLFRRPRKLQSHSPRRALPTCEVLEDRLVPAVSAQEQLFVYLLNRARHDPVAYQQEQNLPVSLADVTPQAPLAVNEDLFDSTEFHASDMAINNYFSHNTQSGLTPNEMVENAGYVLNGMFADVGNNVESIAAGTYIDTAAEALNLLIVDQGVNPPGHRIHLLAMSSYFAAHREIGVGHHYLSTAYYRNYWAIHTALSGSSDKFLTGVVYNDLNSNGRYDLNEGLANVNVSTGSTTVQTNAAGGWSIQVSGTPTLTVTASGGGFSGVSTSTVTVGSENIEVDFISGQASGIVNFEVVAQANQAPVLDPSGNPSLPTIAEDTVNPTGTLISTLIGAAISDANNNAMKGIAVTQVGDGGNWQYSLNGGSSYINFGDVSETSARLLRDTDRIRFVPAANFSGDSTITFQAWDRTTGSAGSTADIVAVGSGGDTAFSLAEETANITVTALNDAPVLAAGAPTLPTVAVNDGNPVGVTVSSLAGASITDVDADALQGIAVIKVGGAKFGRWQYSTDGGTTYLDFGKVAAKTARLLDADDLIRFVPKLGYTATRATSKLPTLSYRAWDQTFGAAGLTASAKSVGKSTAFSTAIQTASVRVNNAPVLTPAAADLGAIASTASFKTTVAALGTTVQDVGTGTLKGIAVTGLSDTTGGKWQYSTNGGKTYLDFGSVAGGTARLLRATDRLRYVPLAGNGGTATITFLAWDQTAGAAGQIVELATLEPSALSITQDTATLNITI